jgi:hypothetical protein
MSAPRSLREVALERTFSLYLRHFTLWLALVLPVVATGAVIFAAVRAAALGSIGPGADPAVLRTVPPMAWAAAIVWGLAGVTGGQICALLVLDNHGNPAVNSVLLAVLRRSPRLLATASLLVVLVAGAGLAGLGVATALIWAPRILLPAMGLTAGTARSLSLLIALPLLVAGTAPALWVLGRHVIALPLAAVAETSPFAILGLARRLSRGHVFSILGLLVVTDLANTAVVLLCRAAAALGTLLVWPSQFRPIFGTGPLDAATTDVGAMILLGATAVAAIVTLPLLFLPVSVFAVELTRQRPVDA